MIKTATLTLHPAAFVSGTYASISGQTYPVGKDENNTTYATINLKTGRNAETTAFWSFDCSSLPSDAVIQSVSCSAKAMTQQTGATRVSTYEMQMYKGTSTAKGSATQLSTTAKSYTMSAGTWTLADLQQCYLRLHAVRGTSSTTTTYYLRFYGATLTITYQYDDGQTGGIYVKENGQWVQAQKVYKKVNGAWAEQSPDDVKTLFDNGTFVRI